MDGVPGTTAEGFSEGPFALVGEMAGLAEERLVDLEELGRVGPHGVEGRCLLEWDS